MTATLLFCSPSCEHGNWERAYVKDKGRSVYKEDFRVYGMAYILSGRLCMVGQEDGARLSPLHGAVAVVGLVVVV